MPLALELAAARMKVLQPGADPRPALSASRPAQGRTGRRSAPADACARRLSGPTNCFRGGATAVRRLAVFAAGCTLDAASRSAAPTSRRSSPWSRRASFGTRTSASGCSRRSASTPSRRLDRRPGRTRLRHRHAALFLELGESANLSAESEGPERPELVRPEAWTTFAARSNGRSTTIPSLPFAWRSASSSIWVMNDPFEGMHRLAAVLGLSGDVPRELRARALRTYAESIFVSGDFEQAAGLMEESLAEFERLGDERAVAVVIHRIGVGALVAKDLPRARQLLEESLAMCRSKPNPKLEADAVESSGGSRAGRETLSGLSSSSSRALSSASRWASRGCRRATSSMSPTSRTSSAAPPLRRSGHARVFGFPTSSCDRRQIVYALALLARFASAEGDVGRAGRLWGALEAEEARGPVAGWEHERAQFAEAILVHTGSELEAARVDGRRLSLDAGGRLRALPRLGPDVQPGRPPRLDRAPRARGRADPRRRRGRPEARDHRDRRPDGEGRRAGSPVRAPEGLRAAAPDQPVRHRAADVPRLRRRAARRRRRQARGRARDAAARRAWSRRPRG